MSEPAVCRHCGYFLDYRIPKAPGEPGWAHTLQTPTKPVGPPCDTPEPHAVHPHDPRPATDGPVLWDSAAPRRPGDLAEFLLARIAEDEAVARAGTPGPWEDQDGYVTAPGPDVQVTDYGSEDLPGQGDDSPHIARWDPARVLAECEAKRRIIRWVREWPWRKEPPSSVDGLLPMLALPYADHSDWREEWRP